MNSYCKTPHTETLIIEKIAVFEKAHLETADDCDYLSGAKLYNDVIYSAMIDLRLIERVNDFVNR